MNDIDTKIQRQLDALLGERDASSRPIWVRAPKDGAVERYSSLGKGTLYALDAGGFIKSACLKRPGAVRGVRLIHLQSILDYIASKTTSHEKQHGPHQAEHE
jgi:hypothetical protein